MTQEITRSELNGAFIAYQLAIRGIIESRPQSGMQSVHKHAKQFGKSITNDDALQVVSSWFKWEEIAAAIE